VYCSKSPKTPISELLSRRQISVLFRFFKTSILKSKLKTAFRQGPATYSPTLAINDTEVISLESTSTIPIVFRISFKDNNQIWLFDIRTLVSSKKINGSSPLKNPYTNQPLTVEQLSQFQRHTEWLNRRKYFLNYATSPSEAQEQPLYRQNLLELVLLLDGHGYLSNTDWFEELSLEDVWRFCNELDSLWLREIGLSDDDRKRICPAWTDEHTSLFPLHRFQTRHLSTALERVSTTLLKFVKASSDKTDQTLACMFILMALCEVSDTCRSMYSDILL
jgi:hypothetical protein